MRSRPRPVGSRALHLMHSGCLFFSTLARRLRACPAHRTLPHALENAHDPASLRTHRNARTRSAAASSPPPRHAPSVSYSRHAGCWWLPGGSRSWVGDGGPRDLFSLGLPPPAAGLLYFPLSSGALRPKGGRPSSGVHPARTFAFPRSLSLSTLFLAWFPFFQTPDFRGKSCFAKFAKVLCESRLGVSGNEGCVTRSILGALAR